MSYVWRISIAAALFASALPLFLFAQTAEEIRAQISSHHEQLDSLNKEIVHYEKELTATTAKKQTLQTAVDALDLSIKKTQAQIKVIQNKIATTELEIKELSGHIFDKETAISIDSAAIAESIRDLQESDQISLAEMIFTNDSMSSVWDDAAQSVTLQANLKVHVQSLREVKQTLTEDKNTEEAKRAELVKQRADLKSEEQSLAVQKKEQQELLSVTKSQESSYQALIKQKQAAKITFEQSLNELESKLQYTLDPSKLPPAGRGILRWPLDNVRITQKFGRTADAARLYSSGAHNGVDFAASIGTPVKAALTGTVIGTGDTGLVRGCYSFGRWVMIKHDNGLSTLYAHLSHIGTTEGATVATGELIGYSGETGYATGPHLHFGVYVTSATQILKLGDATASKTPCANAVMPITPLGGYLNPMNYL